MERQEGGKIEMERGMIIYNKTRTHHTLTHTHNTHTPRCDMGERVIDR